MASLLITILTVSAILLPLDGKNYDFPLGAQPNNLAGNHGNIPAANLMNKDNMYMQNNVNNIDKLNNINNLDDIRDKRPLPSIDINSFKQPNLKNGKQFINQQYQQQEQQERKKSDMDKMLEMQRKQPPPNSDGDPAVDWTV